jgi:hypothetical protein
VYPADVIDSLSALRASAWYHFGMRHTRHTLLTSRLALVRRDLDAVVSRITPDILSWAPAPGMRTISGQLAEIACDEIQVIAWLKDGTLISNPEADALIGDEGDLDNLRRVLVDVRKDTLAYLESLSEEELAEEVAFEEGWRETLGLPVVPRAEAFISIAEHEWYHAGQLTSYLWARGDDPYRW